MVCLCMSEKQRERERQQYRPVSGTQSYLSAEQYSQHTSDFHLLFNRDFIYSSNVHVCACVLGKGPACMASMPSLADACMFLGLFSLLLYLHDGNFK